jgi:hypothetical protein
MTARGVAGRQLEDVVESALEISDSLALRRFHIVVPEK